MKRPLHEQIREVFSGEELSQFSFLLGVEYEDLPGSTRAMKALALQQLMQRTGRMNELLVHLQEQRPSLDLRPFLFYIILEKYSSEAALTRLLQHFGLPVRDFPEPEKFSWGSEAWREQKAIGLQDWVEGNGRVAELLVLLEEQKADLRFYPINQ